MVKVNTVYQTVLLILNKEQRGYMTPAEYVKIAQQVQLEIFEKYFEDLNMYLRQPQNDSEYADRVKTLRGNISIFEESADLLPTAGGPGSFDLPNDFHRLGTLEYIPELKNPIEVEAVNRKIFTDINRSKLTTPDLSNPIYYKFKNSVVVSPPAIIVNPNDFLRLYYVRKPIAPTWNYSIGTVGQYQFTSGNDFELSSIEQTEIVLKILAYAGVIIRDPGIVQTATQMAAAEDAVEKS